MILTASCKNNSVDDSKAVISFKNTEYDFGEITVSEASCEFEFKNLGKIPLIIYNVESCACFKPSWTHEPVMYKESGSVRLVYSVEKEGFIEPTILVHYNGYDSPKKLKVRGEIIAD